MAKKFAVFLISGSIIIPADIMPNTTGIFHLIGGGQAGFKGGIGARAFNASGGYVTANGGQGGVGADYASVSVAALYPGYAFDGVVGKGGTNNNGQAGTSSYVKGNSIFGGVLLARAKGGASLDTSVGSKINIGGISPARSFAVPGQVGNSPSFSGGLGGGGAGGPNNPGGNGGDESASVNSTCSTGGGAANSAFPAPGSNLNTNPPVGYGGTKEINGGTAIQAQNNPFGIVDGDNGGDTDGGSGGAGITGGYLIGTNPVTYAQGGSAKPMQTLWPVGIVTYGPGGAGAGGGGSLWVQANPANVYGGGRGGNGIAGGGGGGGGADDVTSGLPGGLGGNGGDGLIVLEYLVTDQGGVAIIQAPVDLTFNIQPYPHRR